MFEYSIEGLNETKNLITFKKVTCLKLEFLQRLSKAYVGNWSAVNGWYNTVDIIATDEQSIVIKELVDNVNMLEKLYDMEVSK